MQIEGAAGGGLVPWAVLAGLSEQGESGFSAGASLTDTGDYRLAVAGVQWSFDDRVELSLARQSLELSALESALGLDDARLDQTVFGAKVRFAGDLVYGTAPQVVLGAQWKRQHDFALPDALGAEDDSGVDVYLGVARLILDGPFHRNLLVTANLRATRANELGLLGFGSDRDDDYSFVAEGAAALFLNPRVAIGAEYRQKPDHLDAARESDWWDVFVGWFPSKRISVVAAYVDLGEVAGRDGQNGFYVSVNGNF